MATQKLVWDETGKRTYETGVKQTVLYPIQPDNTYSKGVAWSGVTSISESPSGAESTPLWADDTKYINLVSAEEYAETIEAYTYPDEFAECDGSAELQKGVTIGQQSRKMFGLCYKTTLGNDVDGIDHGYKLHLIYGCQAAPSQKGYSTINDNPDAITMSWEITTTPVNVEGYKATSSLTINSTTCDKAKLEALEKILYGSAEAEARLPLPDEIKTLMAPAA